MLTKLEPSEAKLTLWTADTETGSDGELLDINAYNGVEYTTYTAWQPWLRYMAKVALREKVVVRFHNGGSFDVVGLAQRLNYNDTFGGIVSSFQSLLSGSGIVCLTLTLNVDAIENDAPSDPELAVFEAARRDCEAEQDWVGRRANHQRAQAGKSREAKRRAKRAAASAAHMENDPLYDAYLKGNEYCASPVVVVSPPTKTTVRIRIADSFKLLPSPLKDLLGPKGFDVGAKGNVPERYTSKMESYRKDYPHAYHAYHKQDTVGLWKALDKFRDLINDISPVGDLPLTLGALAMKVYRTSFLDYDIITPGRKERDFTRLAYQGGRCEYVGDGAEHPTKLGHYDNVWIYDINSQYPAVMERFLYPYRRGAFQNDPANMRDGAGKIIYGCYKAKFVQRHGIYAILKCRRDDGSVDKEASWEGVTYATSAELNEIEQNGGIVTLYEGYTYSHVAPIFKRFVNDLYAVRRKAESDGNAALKYVVKLLMNNLYGKFGLREDGETNQRLTADQIRKMREKDPDIAIKPYCDDTGEHLEGMYIVVAPIVADYRFPAIGALITAQARLRLLELSNHKGVRIIYCDTDSLHLQPSAEYSRGIPDELVNPGVLGLFKLEEQGVPATYSCRKGYLTPKGLKNKGLPAGSISADVWQAAVESGKTSGGGFIRGQYNAPATFKSAMASGNLTPNKFAPKIRSHISDPSSKAKGLIR